MNFSNDILLVLLLSIFTEANDVDLNTNTNFLLLLLLTLNANENNNHHHNRHHHDHWNGCTIAGVGRTCSGRF